ncbi:MAG: terminase TerL endonuclease subunit [Pontixanthobacter sp.]
MRGSADRHLRDIRDAEARGLYWRPDAAAHALGFLPAVLAVTDGPSAGQPFHPLAWHTFVVGSLFGWRTSTDRLRFRSAWLETGKGQAKSPLMAAIGLYVMGWFEIARAQVFAIGNDKATANVLFRDAAAMCRSDIPGMEEGDSLEARGEVVVRGEGDNASKIEHPESGSFFKTLAGGEKQSGPRPALVLADEIHEFRTDGPLKIWEEAIAKVATSAIMVLGTNTPATTQHVGKSYSDLYQDIAVGKVKDDTAFSFVARVDKDDRDTVFTNEACWAKSLPALGETFPIENIRERVNTARTRISTSSSVKRLYFGIEVGAADFWIDENSWSQVQSTAETAIDTSDLRGKKCYLALDLSKKNDLTALTADWITTNPDEPIEHQVKTWYWTTKDGLEDREKSDNAPYSEWVEENYLTALPGAVIDMTFIAVQVRNICAEHEVAFLAFDTAFMLSFEEACEEIGFEVWRYEGPGKPEGRGLKLVAHAQGTKVLFEDKQLCMPKSITKLEDAILAQNIVIDASPVTYSCAANAALIEDGQANRAFDKKRSRGRIDGLVTIAMAVGAAAMNEKPAKKSVYARRGAIRL